MHTLASVSIYDDTKAITFKSLLNYVWYIFKYFVGWYLNRYIALFVYALCILILLGTIYGIYVENWSVITSLYWAITTLTTAGLQSAPCINTGNDNNYYFYILLLLIIIVIIIIIIDNYCNNYYYCNYYYCY